MRNQNPQGKKIVVRNDAAAKEDDSTIEVDDMATAVVGLSNGELKNLLTAEVSELMRKKNGGFNCTERRNGDIGKRCQAVLSMTHTIKFGAKPFGMIFRSLKIL